MKSCDKCGADLQVDWIYCRACGLETRDSKFLQKMGLAEGQGQEEGYRGHTHQSVETYKVQSYSYWLNSQRRLCDALKLSNAKKAFGKYCDICGEVIPTRSHKNLCTIHKKAWQLERHRRNQAAYTRRKRSV